MNEVAKDLRAAVLESIPAEERLEGLSAEEVLKCLSAEERLESLSAEEVLRIVPSERRLEGLSADQIAGALSEQQLASLRELLEQRRPGGEPPRSGETQ